MSQKKVGFRNFQHSGPGPERRIILANFGQILDLLGMWNILGQLMKRFHMKTFHVILRTMASLYTINIYYDYYVMKNLKMSSRFRLKRSPLSLKKVVKILSWSHRARYFDISS